MVFIQGLRQEGGALVGILLRDCVHLILYCYEIANYNLIIYATTRLWIATLVAEASEHIGDIGYLSKTKIAHDFKKVNNLSLYQ